MKKSWQTTVFGTGGILAILSDTLQKLFDGDAATNPDWNIVVMAISLGVGLIRARDNKVTSEQAGAK